MDKSLILKGLSKKAKDAGTPSPGESSTFLTGAQFVVGALGVAIVLIYPIGFLTLWLQIMRTSGYDSQDALYAASLVPTNVVAGQAIWVLGYAPTSAFIVYFIGLTFGSAFTSLKKDRFKKDSTNKNPTNKKRWSRLINSPLLPFGIVLLIGGLSVLKAYLLVGQGAMSNTEANIWAGVIGPLIVGGALSWILLPGTTTARGSGRYTRYAAAAVVVFASVLFSGVCAAAYSSGPGLPTIELKVESREKHLTEKVSGSLLAHSEGSWYFIRSSDDKHPLKAIPNERVSEVKIAERESPP